MPIYAYRCSACGHAKDVLQKMSDPLLTTCPACGAETFTKQVTAAGFQLKGSGWYVTDFKGSGAAPAPAGDPKSEAKSEAKGEAKADGKTDTGAESKAEAKAVAKPDAKPDSKSDSKPARAAAAAPPAAPSGGAGTTH